MKARLTLLLMLLPVVATAGHWPTVEHPRDARIENIGEQVRLNGIPMRMTRTLAAAPVDEVVAHYRKVLGPRVAHSQVEGTQVLAHERGDFFITVTINPLEDGLSEALLSIADMPAAREAADRPLGFTLPAGSELLSDMESIDGPVSSRQFVVMNTHGLHANLERFSASLADRGLRPDGPALADSEEALVQRFEGQSGEAKLVLVRRDGATHVVLTMLFKHP